MIDQDDMLAEFYAEAFDAMAAAGMTYQAVYQASDDADPIPCTVLASVDLESLGDYARVSAGRFELGLRKAEVGTPVAGATVTTRRHVFVLDVQTGDDEALARWVVGRG